MGVAFHAQDIRILNADTSVSAPPPRRPLIAILLASVAYGLLAMTVCLPSMPAWASQFGVPQGSLQLTCSAFVVA